MVASKLLCRVRGCFLLKILKRVIMTVIVFLYAGMMVLWGDESLYMSAYMYYYVHT